MRSKSALFEALADVRELRRIVLDRQLFSGYSGHARILGGCFALIGAIILSQRWIPSTLEAHIVGWGTVCALSGMVNLIALAHWWKQSESDLDELRPVLDLLAPFSVGALLSLSLIAQSNHDLLFPMWMWLFGLMNISSRHSMPRSMTYLGWYYILAGTACLLLLPATSFMNPWPMGSVFFVGEALGGVTFLRLRKEEEAI